MTEINHLSDVGLVTFGSRCRDLQLSTGPVLEDQPNTGRDNNMSKEIKTRMGNSIETSGQS